MTIKIPEDPSIAGYDAKHAERRKLLGEISEINRAKELARTAFKLAQTDPAHALVDSEGRDLSQAAFQKAQRELDEREADCRQQLRVIDTDIEVLGRARRRAVEALNRDGYIAILRRRAKALVEVAKCNDEETRFRDSLRDLDAGSGFRPMAIRAVGDWSDDQSLAQFHVAELGAHFPELANEDFE